MTQQQDEQEILQTERRRFEAMVKGDLVALERILADDLQYTHSNGVFDTKASFIATLKSGELQYQGVTPEDLRARVYGSTAVVTGVSLMNVRVRGQQASFRVRFTDVYVKRDDRWQMVAWQAARLPEQ
jgi:ketosteroid isomerase-like protein